MSEEKNTNRDPCRPCWQNCGVEADAEMLKIDAMEDSLAPLDEHTAGIRWLITRFEACYHQADKEAERIARAIGAGHCPRESKTRPPKRKKELGNTCRILSQWCREPAVRGLNLDVGDYGEPCASKTGEHYKDDAAFLEQTRATLIHDTVDGRKARISLGLAIDLLMPCHWDFVEALVIILKAIGGDLNPQRPFACCSRNLQLSPLCDRLRTISNTLRDLWADETLAEGADRRILTLLGTPTPIKCWLAASLDKTIRLQLEHASDFWLKFS